MAGEPCWHPAVAAHFLRVDPALGAGELSSPSILTHASLGSAPSVLSTLQVGNRGREVTAGRRQAGLQPVLLTSAQPG